MSRFARNLVVIGRDPLREELLDLLIEADYFDVIFVESVERGYSRIREVRPRLVIVYIDFDDVAGWQLLSMLKTDSTLAGIPVETCTVSRADPRVVHIMPDLAGGSAGVTPTPPMH